MNIYGYVGGDPVNFRDPSGLEANDTDEADDEQFDDHIVVRGGKRRGRGLGIGAGIGFSNRTISEAFTGLFEAVFGGGTTSYGGSSGGAMQPIDPLVPTRMMFDTLNTDWYDNWSLANFTCYGEYIGGYCR